MKKTDEEIRIGVDALQSDMATHQRITGKAVTAEPNRLLVAETYERLEKEWADRTEAPTSQADHVVETRIADVNGRRYTIDKRPDDIRFRRAVGDEVWQMRCLEARVQILMSAKDSGPLGQPSYHTRLLAVTSHMTRAMQLAMAGRQHEAAELELRFRTELIALCDDSSKHFGDWRKPPPQTEAA